MTKKACFKNLKHMKKPLLLLFILSAFVLSISSMKHPTREITAETRVSQLLQDAGEEKPAHHIEYDEEDVQRGYELIHEGRTTKPGGGRSKPISKFYSCRSCHNVAREDLNLTQINPDERLQYAIKHRLPYLQGSTFWGIVNRETWYNDDYVLKYGDLVRKAEHSLVESTQLCARVCAQGRTLEEWEVKSILAYYWSLEMKVKDLSVAPDKLREMNEKLASGDHEEVIKWVKSKYLTKSPATFTSVPKDKNKGYELEGRPELGKVIYEQGCQHCHRPYGESDLVLDDARYTFQWLMKNIGDNSPLSLYEIIRKGTYSELGHKEYMPHYTLEKMSDQQVEDLRAYIQSRAR